MIHVFPSTGSIDRVCWTWETSHEGRPQRGRTIRTQHRRMRTRYRGNTWWFGWCQGGGGTHSQTSSQVIKKIYGKKVLSFGCIRKPNHHPYKSNIAMKGWEVFPVAIFEKLNSKIWLNLNFKNSNWKLYPDTDFIRFDEQLLIITKSFSEAAFMCYMPKTVFTWDLSWLVPGWDFIPGRVNLVYADWYQCNVLLQW